MQDEERKQLTQLRDVLKSALQVEQKEVTHIHTHTKKNMSARVNLQQSPIICDILDTNLTINVELVSEMTLTGEVILNNSSLEPEHCFLLFFRCLHLL